MCCVFWVGLELPSDIHKGKVTDSSIEILWNRVDGNFQHYEITCLNCTAALMVRYRWLLEALTRIFHAEPNITVFLHYMVVKLNNPHAYLVVLNCGTFFK